MANTKIWEINKQILSCLDIERNLNFNEYVSSLSRKASNNYLFYQDCKIF